MLDRVAKSRIPLAKLFCAIFSDAKRILRARTVFAAPTDDSTRLASKAGIESAKKFLLLFISVIINATSAFSAEKPLAVDANTVRLVNGYPELEVFFLPGNDQEIAWEIRFCLGPRPEQWDKIVIGEILAESVKRGAIAWALFEDGSQNASGSSLQMSWLAPGTIGWSLEASEEKPFELLKGKNLSLKLKAHMDPVLAAGISEGILNGTFINCYKDHALVNRNRSYTGTESSDASTRFDPMDLFVPSDPLPEPNGDWLEAPQEELSSSIESPPAEQRQEDGFQPDAYSYSNDEVNPSEYFASAITDEAPPADNAEDLGKDIESPLVMEENAYDYEPQSPKALEDGSVSPNGGYARSDAGIKAIAPESKGLENDLHGKDEASPHAADGAQGSGAYRESAIQAQENSLDGQPLDIGTAVADSGKNPEEANAQADLGIIGSVLEPEAVENESQGREEAAPREAEGMEDGAINGESPMQPSQGKFIVEEQPNEEIGTAVADSSKALDEASMLSEDESNSKGYPKATAPKAGNQKASAQWPDEGRQFTNERQINDPPGAASNPPYNETVGNLEGSENESRALASIEAYPYKEMLEESQKAASQSAEAQTVSPAAKPTQIEGSPNKTPVAQLPKEKPKPLFPSSKSQSDATSVSTSVLIGGKPASGSVMLSQDYEDIDVRIEISLGDISQGKAVEVSCVFDPLLEYADASFAETDPEDWAVEAGEGSVSFMSLVALKELSGKTILIEARLRAKDGAMEKLANEKVFGGDAKPIMAMASMRLIAPEGDVMRVRGAPSFIYTANKEKKTSLLKAPEARRTVEGKTEAKLSERPSQLTFQTEVFFKDTSLFDNVKVVETFDPELLSLLSIKDVLFNDESLLDAKPLISLDEAGFSFTLGSESLKALENKTFAVYTICAFKGGLSDARIAQALEGGGASTVDLSFSAVGGANLFASSTARLSIDLNSSQKAGFGSVIDGLRVNELKELNSNSPFDSLIESNAYDSLPSIYAQPERERLRRRLEARAAADQGQANTETRQFGNDAFFSMDQSGFASFAASTEQGSLENAQLRTAYPNAPWDANAVAGAGMATFAQEALIRDNEQTCSGFARAEAELGASVPYADASNQTASVAEADSFPLAGQIHAPAETPACTDARDCARAETAYGARLIGENSNDGSMNSLVSKQSSSEQHGLSMASQEAAESMHESALSQTDSNAQEKQEKTVGSNASLSRYSDATSAKGFAGYQDGASPSEAPQGENLPEVFAGIPAEEENRNQLTRSSASVDAEAYSSSLASSAPLAKPISGERSNAVESFSSATASRRMSRVADAARKNPETGEEKQVEGFASVAFCALAIICFFALAFSMRSAMNLRASHRKLDLKAQKSIVLWILKKKGKADKEPLSKRPRSAGYGGYLT
jgi:hypothetical protein